MPCRSPATATRRRGPWPWGRFPTRRRSSICSRRYQPISRRSWTSCARRSLRCAPRSTRVAFVPRKIALGEQGTLEEERARYWIHVVGRDLAESERAVEGDRAFHGGQGVEAHAAITERACVVED